MTLYDFLVGMFALLACGAMIYFFILPSANPTNLAPSTVRVESLPTVFAQQPLQVTIAATSAKGKTIILEANGEVEQIPCDQDPCIFSRTYTFSAPGAQTIRATVDRLTYTHAITVSALVSRCIDGTIEGECSTPPLQCENAKLVSRCSVCGCDEGKICQNDSCVDAPFSFSFIEFSPQSTYFMQVAGDIPYVIQNTSGFSANGIFVMVLSAYDASEKILDEEAQQVQLTELSPAGVYSGKIRYVFPPLTKFVRLRFYDSASTYPNSTLLAESQRESISIAVDTTPPLPPLNVDISSVNGAFVLSWDASPSSDVAFYRIYQENFATGGFTTYSVLAETSALSYPLPAATQERAYVLRAVDGAFNESDPTSPIVGGAS